MRRLLPAIAAIVILLPSSARAVYQCGAQKDTCQCGANDPYPCCGNGGNCTWFAWESACCHWGIALPGWGNANQWTGNARARGYNIIGCGTPVDNTIANWTGGADGHVAWTTALLGGGRVQVQEQNCGNYPGSMDVANYGRCWFTDFIARGGQVQCNPGDSQVQGCGAGGTQSRGCNDNGQWGGWSACSVQSCGGPTGVPPAPASCGRIAAGEGLGPGASVSACGGCFTLVMQGDGNLVLYKKGGGATWASNTGNGHAFYMQSDGNAVLYTGNGCPAWASGTGGHGGASYAVQDDGNLVVYASNGQAIWASNSVACPGGCTCFAPLAISPASATTSPGGRVNFAVSGGGGSDAWSMQASPSGGQVTDTGAYTAGSTGSVVDVVQVTDGFGHTATARITVGPTLTLAPATASTPPLGSVTFTSSGGSGGAHWSIPVNGSGGTISPTGVYTAGRTGDVTDTVQVTDSLGNSATAKVSVGPALSLMPASGSTPPLGSLSFTVTGGSGDGLVWSVNPDASGGTVSASGLYTAGSTGNTTDTLVVTDSLGNTAVATIAVGPPITIQSSATTTPPNGSLTFTATGGSGTGFVWSETGLSGGSISADGVYHAGARGKVIDTVQVTDSLGNTGQILVTVGAGVSVSPAVSAVAPNGTIAFTAAGGSGTGFMWSVVSAPSGGTITSAGAYQAGATGNAVDTVQVVDSLGNVAQGHVEVGPGLTILPATAAVAPKGTITFTASGGTVGGYTWKLLASPSGGRLSSGGVYIAGVIGGVTDTIQVTDTHGASALAQVTVGPSLTLAPATLTVAPRQAGTFAVTGGSGVNDVWSLPQNGSGGSISSSGGYVAGPTGNTTDTVQVVDSLGNIGQAVVTIGPGLTLVPTTVTLPPLGQVSFTASGGTGTGEIWSFTTNGSGGSISSAGLYQAGTTPNTTDVITVVDSAGNTAAAQVSIGAGLTITPSDSVVTAPQGVVDFSVQGGSGIGYTWSISHNASGGTVSNAGVYTAGSLGNAVDTVEVKDSLGNTATVQVRVTPGLIITPPMAQIAPQGSLAFKATGGSGQSVTWSMLSAPSGGSVTAGGVYTAGSVSGVVDVVAVSDSLGNTSSAQVAVGAGVTVWPASTTVPPHGSVMLSATGGSGGGYTWSLPTASAGGTITTGGVYTAGGQAGVTDVPIVVDSLGNAASAAITVGAGVTISPDQAMVAPMEPLHFAASGGSGSGWTWSIPANASGGSISSDGIYTAGSLGGVVDTVQVADDLGNVATAQVGVGAVLLVKPASAQVAPSGQLTFSATGGSSAGLTWSIDPNASGATITKDGVYTAGTTGGVHDTVRVSDSLGNTGTAEVIVGQGVTLQPAAPMVPPGSTLTFQATGGSGQGFQWSLVKAPSGGTITPSGVYTAGRIGQVSDVVKAVDSRGNTGTATIQVGNGVSVTPATIAVAKNGHVTFSATGGSGQGFVWRLKDNASGAKLGADGQYTAGPGSGIDHVQVTDSLGNTAIAEVDVGNPSGVGRVGVGGCGCGDPDSGALALIGLLLGPVLVSRRRRGAASV